MEEKRYLISEASKKLGMEPHVLRYWEEELELPIHRNEQGHRYYTETDLRVYREIHELKEQGLLLKALKRMVPEMYEKKTVTMDRIREGGQLSTTYVKIKPTDRQRKSQGKPDGRTMVHSLSYAKQAAATAESMPTAGQGREENEKQIIENNSSYEEDRPMGESERKNTEVVEQKPQDILSNEHKLEQFQKIMNQAVSRALSEQQKAIGEALGSCVSEEVSERVSDKVLKQMDYLMRESDDQAERRYQKLDETIREVQKARMEAAATENKKKGLVRRKHKKQ